MNTPLIFAKHIIKDTIDFFSIYINETIPREFKELKEKYKVVYFLNKKYNITEPVYYDNHIGAYKCYTDVLNLNKNIITDYYISYTHNACFIDFNVIDDELLDINGVKEHDIEININSVDVLIFENNKWIWKDSEQLRSLINRDKGLFYSKITFSMKDTEIDCDNLPAEVKKYMMLSK